MPKQPRSSATRKPRPKIKRRTGVPPVVARARVAPLAASAPRTAEQAPAKPRVPGAMDFSYVGKELRRIVVVTSGVIILMVVLSFFFR